MCSSSKVVVAAVIFNLVGCHHGGRASAGGDATEESRNGRVAQADDGPVGSDGQGHDEDGGAGDGDGSAPPARRSSDPQPCFDACDDLRDGGCLVEDAWPTCHHLCQATTPEVVNSFVGCHAASDSCNPDCYLQLAGFSCIPSAARPCVCADGGVGTQWCQDDGEQWSPCEACDSPQ